MRSAAFSIFMLVLSTAYSQYRLSGFVSAENDSAVIKECVVYLNNEKNVAITDSRGRFAFDNVSDGSFTLHFTHPDFRYKQVLVDVSGDVFVTVALQSFGETLQEVVISEVSTGFGFSKLNSIHDMAIYEGKKTEVIIPDQMVVNLATNNARQIYSKVAGLNIWENDGAGLQLSIGGRGLDPNRTSNFNVRQNGYDISADALGYPESYYTPPVEAVGKIEIVRGAASLQYGTQFGGLINFTMKKPATEKKLELIARNTVGSFGFFNTFTSASGTVNKLSYYGFFQFKTGNGWRGNSTFTNHNAYAHVGYQLSANTRLGIDITHMDYLAQQPGGLSDDMFRRDARQTNRMRNWFSVDWNLFAVHANHRLTEKSDLNVRVFGLAARRYSIGFRPNRVESPDDNSERDLIRGTFSNWGAEARYLLKYGLLDKSAALLIGSRYYHGFNHSMQGLGSAGNDADFRFYNPEQFLTYDYTFPNKNVSGFIENIFYLSEKFSLTPGFRYEYIKTTATGFYGNIIRDLAGNVLSTPRYQEDRDNARQFLIGGLGVSFKPNYFVELYSNISQNYRSITFNDMRISNPSAKVDQNLTDEQGYSLDVGIRSDQTSVFRYDVSAFYLNYDNRIGEIQEPDDKDRVYRKRDNIGQAVITGIETYGEADIIGIIHPALQHWSAAIFSNAALIKSVYKQSDIPEVEGNEVEFVPAINLKSGVRMGYRSFKLSFQYTYLSSQFSDATNSKSEDESAIVGVIPSYTILDLSSSYTYKRFRVECSINNLGNALYFTRRATGYPGPGILPSDGRSLYFTLQVKL